jgi:predicted nuclease with TOPRIM domain
VKQQETTMSERQLADIIKVLEDARTRLEELREERDDQVEALEGGLEEGEKHTETETEVLASLTSISENLGSACDCITDAIDYIQHAE